MTVDNSDYLLFFLLTHIAIPILAFMPNQLFTAMDEHNQYI